PTGQLLCLGGDLLYKSGRHLVFVRSWFLLFRLLDFASSCVLVSHAHSLPQFSDACQRPPNPDLAGRLAHRVQLTTDGHRAYLSAVEDAFGSNVDYAM